jgi:hypothetical protein
VRILSSHSLFFLPLKVPSTSLGVLSLSKEGGSEVGVKFSPLTPTLSHGGEMEDEGNIDYIRSASLKNLKRLLRGYQ